MPDRDCNPLEGEYDYESSSDGDIQEEGDFKIPAETAISKTAHLRFMKNAFANADLFVKNKVTHVLRRSGASMASLAGVPEDEFAVWFIRVMAGFVNNSVYHLLRAVEVPCEALQQMVFPLVDYWLARLAEDTVDRSSCSVVQFLKLLKCFRITLPQDAAVMIELFPGLKAHVLANVEPESAVINNFAPEVEHQLIGIKRVIEDYMTAMAERQAAAENSIQKLHFLAASVISGNQPLQLPVMLNNGADAMAATINANLNASCNTSNIPASIPSSSSTNFFSSTSANHTSSATIRSTDVNGIPIYKMSRNIKTVKQLYEEWTLGLNGYWPVQQLEEEWGTKWRQGDKKCISLRRHVVDAVNDLVTDLHLSIDEAIEKLQVAMTKRGLALDGLGTFDILETWCIRYDVSKSELWSSDLNNQSSSKLLASSEE
ncbi:hypothetical protein [Parasitella parasitica]|uniref:Transcription activator GCR1-like domain-containing protein n=1 Tax=Parasitella parasitica TaxID=35722 RepID=A0A0B7NIW5_9FUNG|nr:hypothetical protein [Parasitella parasitica]